MPLTKVKEDQWGDLECLHEDAYCIVLITSKLLIYRDMDI